MCRLEWEGLLFCKWTEPKNSLSYGLLSLGDFLVWAPAMFSHWFKGWDKVNYKVLNLAQEHCCAFCKQTFYQTCLVYPKTQRAGTWTSLDSQLMNSSELDLLMNAYQIGIYKCMIIWAETCCHYDSLTRLQRKANYCSFQCSWRLLWSTKSEQTDKAPKVAHGQIELNNLQSSHFSEGANCMWSMKFTYVDHEQFYYSKNLWRKKATVKSI